MSVKLNSYKPMTPDNYIWTTGDEKDVVSQLIDQIFFMVVPPLVEEGLKDFFPHISSDENGELIVVLYSENSCLGRDITLHLSLSTLLNDHIADRDYESLERLKALLESCLQTISKKSL